jgi:hypothetical protein
MEVLANLINLLVVLTSHLSFFCRLVDTINNSIGQDSESKSLIGVLDIYGFESFKTNRCVTGTPFVM